MKTSVVELTNIPVTEKVFVGIDPSLTSTGVALIRDGVLSTSSVTPKMKGPERLDFFCQWFSTRLLGEDITMLALEGYAFGAPGHLAGLGELGGVIRLLLHRAGVPFLVVPPTTLKKFATGKGGGEKGMVSKELFKRYGVDVTGNDEADAAGLALYAMATYMPDSFKLTQPQTDALKGSELFVRPSKPETVSK